MSARTAETNEDTVTLRGVPRTYLSTKAPYLDHGGELLGVVGIATEITGASEVNPGAATGP